MKNINLIVVLLLATIYSTFAARYIRSVKGGRGFGGSSGGGYQSSAPISPSRSRYSGGGGGGSLPSFDTGSYGGASVAPTGGSYGGESNSGYGGGQYAEEVIVYSIFNRFVYLLEFIIPSYMDNTIKEWIEIQTTNKKIYNFFLIDNIILIMFKLNLFFSQTFTKS